MTSLTDMIGEMVRDFFDKQFDHPFSMLYGAKPVDADATSIRFACDIGGDTEIVYEVSVKALGFRKRR
jgi:hypothetical protein